jgi:DNA-binding NarL/FixJ family response regulator
MAGYIYHLCACYNVQNKLMILIASPSKALCRRWREALAGAGPIHEIGDKQALFHFLRESKPSVLLVDYDNDHFGTISFLRAIIKTSPSTRGIVFTSDPTANGAVAAIKSGAKGYGPKNLSGPLIRKAVHAVCDGEIWIGRKYVSMLIRELASFNQIRKEVDLKSGKNRPAPVLDILSARQREIISLIAIGKPNKAISSHLSISEKTVKAHLTTIFRKLGVSGRTQLALFVSQRNPLHYDSNLKPPTKVSLPFSPIAN